MKKLPILVFAALASCGSPTPHQEDSGPGRGGKYILEATDETLRFALDETTPVWSFCMFPHNERGGRRYLAYLNQSRNQILFFDLDSQALSHRVQLAYEGTNKVGEAVGFKVQSLDSIFITPMLNPTIFLVNREGAVLASYEYGELTNGMPFDARSGSGMEIAFHDGGLYIPALLPGGYGQQNTQEEREKHKVCAVMDTASRQGRALDFTFPGDYWDGGFKPMFYSRILAGGKFIYSFYFHHDIFVLNPGHDTVIRKAAKSEYLSEFVPWNSNEQRFVNYLAQAPHYRNIIHDPYRKLYYRIVNHAFELTPESDELVELRYPAKFSVMILDEDFNVLGETLMPERTYYAYGFFVAQEGLYFQQSHPDHPDYTEDSLEFRHFKPVPVQ